MNKKQVKAISLKDFNRDINQEERTFIEVEKKYYQIVVALKQKRERLGLTQTQLALMAKVPRTTITRVESGSRNATLQTVMALAQAMGKTVELRLV